MATEQQSRARSRVKPYRRVVQILVLATLILVPYYTQNPMDWAPSRIVQGLVPPPATFDVLGDTWSFEVNGFRLAHPLAFFDTWLSGQVIYIPLFIAMLIPLVLTILLGRIFCSWLCPVGFLLELNMMVQKALVSMGLSRNYTIGDQRYFILFCCLVMAFIFAIPVLSVVDPPHVLGRELMNFFTHHTVSFVGAALLVTIVVLDLFVSHRMVCSKLCPSGGGLSLLGKFRCLRIKVSAQKCVECGKCDETCPYQLEPMGLVSSRPFDWTTCDNCGLCRDSCPEGAIEYSCSSSKMID